MGKDENIDTLIGIRYGDNRLQMSNKEIRVDNGHDIVRDNAYVFTLGLWSLITEKVPDNYSREDLYQCKTSLSETIILHKDTI